MRPYSRNFFLALFFLLPSTLHAQADAEIEQVSLLTFLGMCGFVLLAVLIVCSVIAQGLIGFGLISPNGKLGPFVMWLAKAVSDIRVVDRSRNSNR